MKYYCSLCKKEITEAEQLYSIKNCGKALCRSHQKTINNGLSKKEGRYKEGMIKGRIAETLIEELFLSLGYNVFRYGMENTVPAITKLLQDVKSEVADINKTFNARNSFKGKIGIFDIEDNKINHRLNFYKIEKGSLKEIF